LGVVSDTDISFVESSNAGTLFCGYIHARVFLSYIFSENDDIIEIELVDVAGVVKSVRNTYS
jgi:hypothetical protein